MTSDLDMSHGKIAHFVSFLLLGFTLVIKLRNCDFESHWNTLMFFTKKRYGVRFQYVLWKNVSFCFISIVSITLFHLQYLSHKISQFWYWKSFKYCNIFWPQKNNVRFYYVLSNSVWFRILAISWEIQILNFIETF